MSATRHDKRSLSGFIESDTVSRLKRKHATMLRRLCVVVALLISTVSVAVAVVPGPPRTLTASVSGNVVSLTWQPPESGTQPSSYRVEATLSSGGTAITFLSVPISPLVVRDVPQRCLLRPRPSRERGRPWPRLKRGDGCGPG